MMAPVRLAKRSRWMLEKTGTKMHLLFRLRVPKVEALIATEPPDLAPLTPSPR